MDLIARNLYTKYVSLEITMIQFDNQYFSRGYCCCVYFQILVVVLSQILLHGIIQNFTFNILILKEGCDIIFASIVCKGVLLSHLFQNFVENSNFCDLLNEIASKFVCKIIIFGNSSYAFQVHFRCIHFRQSYFSVFFENARDNRISVSITWNLKKNI